MKQNIFQFSTYYFFSLFMMSGSISLAQLKIIQDDFYAAYRFSDSIQGMAFTVNEQDSENSLVDSLFREYCPAGAFQTVTENKSRLYVPVDTESVLHFYKNIALENAMLKIISNNIFVLCTKGVVSRTITDVLFSVSECKTNIVVFRFAPVDTARFGYPIFCTRKLLNYTFGTFPGSERRLGDVKDIYESEYRDNIETELFAKSDSIYFTFRDSFNRNNPHHHDGVSRFPERAVYCTGQNKRMSVSKRFTLDLFGIPCD